MFMLTMETFLVAYLTDTHRDKKFNYFITFNSSFKSCSAGIHLYTQFLYNITLYSTILIVRIRKVSILENHVILRDIKLKKKKSFSP